MEKIELVDRYKNDERTKAIAEFLIKNNDIGLKGLKGSLDAILASALFLEQKKHNVFLLHDQEEAHYFYNDLKSLSSRAVSAKLLFFPSSYKNPYKADSQDKYASLQRSEALCQLKQSDEKFLIVSYPEAIAERVINAEELSHSTFEVKKGDEIEVDFILEILENYGFTKVDFVYEPGEFSQRGGIIDLYSFSAELPFRIELFGDEVESIRTFNPENQLSIEKLEQITILGNTNSQRDEAQTQSLLDFITEESNVWFKDYEQCLDIINKISDEVSSEENKAFESSTSFITTLESHKRIAFGNRFSSQFSTIHIFETETQPSFNKNFPLLADTLDKFQNSGFQNIICSASQTQLNRLHSIFEELNSGLKVESICLDLREGFIDKDAQRLCFTDHQIFERFHRYKEKKQYSGSKAMTLKELRTLQIGDYVTHIDNGVGRFAGLEVVENNGKRQEAVRLVYRDNDLLYVSIHSLHKISKYSGKEGIAVTVNKLGSAEWDKKKKRVKKHVMDIAEDLIQLYAERKQTKGNAFSVDSFLQAELESSFLYEDTPDQAEATSLVKKDMEKEHPMDRLVCGDVGFGKTEVAIRAAFKAVDNNKQVAVLVPTTILASQHFNTFSERLKDLPVNVAYINRFKTTKEIKETLSKLKDRKLDILIGTQRILNKDVEFKDLGLLVVDEEQKFGVKAKERLKEMRVNVDVLTLTATPIPRTLHFSLMGARDLSVIATPPQNRQPVSTMLESFNAEVIKDAIHTELSRNGQVFFVHNRLKDIEEMRGFISTLAPEANIGVAHGQMEGKTLETIMNNFINGNYDILLSTNIIESGLDIPNANTIIINHAHMFGLSDLHQMRGRVGRSNRKAYCYLLSPPTSTLTKEARKRLSTLEEFSELGDGFKVAMRDLDIRGAGNLLGAEQSGFISDLGFELYHKILDDTVQELKDTKFHHLFKNEKTEFKEEQVFTKECTIETDMELIIPEDYVKNISERLNLYSQFDKIEEEEELDKLRKHLIDRFGTIPDTTENLIQTFKIRIKAKKIGIEKLILKNKQMKAFFISSDNEAFYQSESFGLILSYLQENPSLVSLKEHKDRLILNVKNIDTIENLKNTFYLLSKKN